MPKRFERGRKENEDVGDQRTRRLQKEPTSLGGLTKTMSGGPHKAEEGSINTRKAEEKEEKAEEKKEEEGEDKSNITVIAQATNNKNNNKEDGEEWLGGAGDIDEGAQGCAPVRTQGCVVVRAHGGCLAAQQQDVQQQQPHSNCVTLQRVDQCVEGSDMAADPAVDEEYL